MAKTAADPVRDAFARAASRLALVHRIHKDAGGAELYAVGSSTNPDSGYVVAVIGGTIFACTCPSEIRPACWHRAAVAIRRANDRAAAEHHARAAGLTRRPVHDLFDEDGQELPLDDHEAAELAELIAEQGR